MREEHNPSPFWWRLWWRMQFGKVRPELSAVEMALALIIVALAILSFWAQ